MSHVLASRTGKPAANASAKTSVPEVSWYVKAGSLSP
jgi:hypothetical protein